MKIAPQQRRKESKPQSLTQASNVVELRSWANDHGRDDVVSQFDRLEERQRFDADMAECEAIEEALFRVTR